MKTKVVYIINNFDENNRDAKIIERDSASDRIAQEVASVNDKCFLHRRTKVAIIFWHRMVSYP